MSSSSKSRHRSRSPVKRSSERSHHSGSAEKIDKRSSKDSTSGVHEHGEKTLNHDAKANMKAEKNDVTYESNSSSPRKDTKPNSNSFLKSLHGSSSSRTYVNPLTGKTERKFSSRCRLFVGNISDMNEEEFTKLFEKYGEYTEAYVNKDKGFGFIKMDTRMAAEAAKNALDGSARKGRALAVRFATLSTAVHVSNLGPLVSNEMLEKAFSTFGDVEKAVVVVDDRGKSKGYGRVEYARKGNALNAIQRTSEGFFMIGRSPRPVFTKPQEQTDDEDGLVEKSIERQPQYYSERDAGASFVPPGSFEYEWCQKWKQLEETKRAQLEALESQFREAEEKLEAEMVAAIADYEAELNRRELLAKQLELQRQEEMMRQELMRQQAMEIRRHEEVRIHEELRRQEELRMQEETLRLQQEDLFRRRQQEEAALLYGARMPNVPVYGVASSVGAPTGLVGSSVPGVHSRMVLSPMQRLPLSSDARHHGAMAYEFKGERGRELRTLERVERARSGSRYHDHSSRDRY